MSRLVSFGDQYGNVLFTGNEDKTGSLAFNANTLPPGLYRISAIYDGAIASDSLSIHIANPTQVGYSLQTIAGGNGNSEDIGDGGPASSATFQDISSVAVDRDGNIYLSSPCCCIRRIDSSGTISTYLANSSATSIAVAPDGTLFMIRGYKVFKVVNEALVLVAGSGVSEGTKATVFPPSPPIFSPVPSRSLQMELCILQIFQLCAFFKSRTA